MGSGSVAFASELLLFIPLGMQVFGSKPWFCMKKIMRLGVVLLTGDAKRCRDSSEVAVTLAAIP